MSLKDEFTKLIARLTARHEIPPIVEVFFPPFQKGGQPKDSEFMAMSLEGGATGSSYVLVPDDHMERYTALKPSSFVGESPIRFASEFGQGDSVNEMISIAAINAICQHVMRVTAFPLDTATDSLGLLSIAKGDRIGMVGLFRSLIGVVQEAGAQVVVIEKREALVGKFPDLPITLDLSALASCNKVLCTSTTVLNDSLEDILAICPPETFVSVVGPTAGYFPDPLFSRGVDVVGGRVVTDGPAFLKLLADRKRWGNATRKICFQKETYPGIIMG